MLPLADLCGEAAVATTKTHTISIYQVRYEPMHVFQKGELLRYRAMYLTSYVRVSFSFQKHPFLPPGMNEGGGVAVEGSLKNQPGVTSVRWALSRFLQ